MRIVKSIYHEFEKYHWTKKTIIILTILGVLVLIVNFMIYTKNIKHKQIFITFGAGGENYVQAGERLINQSNELNIFDKTILYTNEYLKNNNEFWNKHYTFIENNKRGYGYWLWKPFIIKKTMEQMKNGDILLYADCGCEIDIKKKDKLLNDIELVKTQYIIGSYTGHDEQKWNKMDLILKLDANDDEYINTMQRQAGVILFLVCDETRNLVNEWYELSCDYHLIDDSPSIAPNADIFIEHRHDQSIFSLLTKKYKIYSDKSISSIEIARNRTGRSALIH